MTVIYSNKFFSFLVVFLARKDFRRDHLPTFNTRSQGHCFTGQLLKIFQVLPPPPSSSCQFCLKRFHIMSRNIGCQLLGPNSRIMEGPGVPGVHCLTRQSLIARRPPVSKRSKEDGSAPLCARQWPIQHFSSDLRWTQIWSEPPASFAAA